MDTYVTDKDGTGIVHQAPGFGEDDHRVAIAYEIINVDEMPPCPIDDAGRFTSEVPDFVGQYVKVRISRDDFGFGLTLSLGRRQGDYESPQSKGPACETRSRKAFISILLEVRMTLWKADFFALLTAVIHRSNTPIIYRAFPVWNVKVAQIVDDLVKNNSETRWCVTLKPQMVLNLFILLSGCRKTLVKTVSEIGWQMHATGLYPGIVIGVPPSPCGFLATRKKYCTTHP